MRTPAEIPGKRTSLTGEAHKEITLPKRIRLFEAHFQKTFRRHNLFYIRKKNLLVCSNFPFNWTSFEYSPVIKISFLQSTTFDYQDFRNESIQEFSHLFKNHKAYWSYPYNRIVIYGDEAFHGINKNDFDALAAYHCYLVEEVTKFLVAREDALLNTPLYKFGNCQ